MQARRSTPLSFAGFGAVLSLALGHIAALAFLRSPVLVSNLVQLLSTLLALLACLRRVALAREQFFRYVWLQLGIAFAIWFAAQGFYLSFLVAHKPMPSFPSTADALWLFYAFPILMVTVTRRTGTRWDWVNLLDAAQAGLFFFVLDALVLSHSRLLSTAVANDVQGIALTMAGAIRYSMAAPGPERVFFRNLGIYLATSASLTSLTLHLGASRYTRWSDLCWTAPFLLFCTLVLASGRRLSSPHEEARIASLPKHLQAVSSLGLAILSTFAGAGLEVIHPVAGLLVIALGFLMFAVRTGARELQLHRAHDTLEHAVLHDPLTGLANRAQLRRELGLRLDGKPGRDGRAALLFLDLDRFKTINDGLGHAFGDQLLIAIAQILRSTAHEAGDLVARLGGDEFVVLTECGSESEAHGRAHAYLHRLRKPLSLDGRVFHLTASAGVVLAQPGAGPDELLRNADCAMYVAKSRGRNQAKLFETSMIQRATDELWLETDLREAVYSGGISVDYQPIYSLAGHGIVGFEALARWRHPTRGMISPGLFIPVAEDTGLVLELGKQILREACRQMENWNRVYRRNFYVSVNVSARQFADSNLLANVRSVLEETQFSPNRLKLEITESVLISGVQTVEAVLTAARRLGVEISLDDFGTGYSSLSYLLRFPFDVVKIDRSFVQSLDRDPQRADLAEMIVRLAARLGKKVVAEGVETVEERQLLERMQCDLLQGYLFSKPLGPAAIEALLQRHAEPSAWPYEEESQIWRPTKTRPDASSLPRHGPVSWEQPGAAASIPA